MTDAIARGHGSHRCAAPRSDGPNVGAWPGGEIEHTPASPRASSPYSDRRWNDLSASASTTSPQQHA